MIKYIMLKEYRIEAEQISKFKNFLKFAFEVFR